MATLIQERYAEKMWKQSRLDAGKSQQYMADALGVSKKTVQNWEQGFSNPGSDLGLRWFQVLGLHSMSYYLQAIYDFNPKDIENFNEKEVDEVLTKFLVAMPLSVKLMMLHMISRSDGANPISIVNLCYANDLAPLRDRVNVAQSIMTNYEVTKALGKLPADMPVSPDMELLQKAVSAGLDAVKKGQDTYSTLIEGLEVYV